LIALASWNESPVENLRGSADFRAFFPLNKLRYNPPDMPILDRHSLEFFSRSADQTRRVGMRLGSLLQSGDVICLQGELGTGKTTLVQGMAAGWGSLDPVSSPTFVLVNLYRRLDGLTMAHLDAYRIASSVEALALDLDALIAGGPLVVEWAERVSDAMPESNLWINLDWVADEHREMQFRALGSRYEEILAHLREDMFGLA
jgi:tRNA threonylcarbamoyladenosine biosynthesis protein TsaE